MKKINKRYSYLLLFTICIVTAFSFLKSSAVSSQKNEVRTNPNTEYQITYELNGGRFEGEYPKTFKISQETAIPNPIKDGSEFLGWTINDKTDVSPVKDYKIPSMTQEDVKLTANWKSSQVILMSGEQFRKTLEGMSGFSNVEEIRFVYGTPNPNGTNVSDGSIKAHIEGNVLTVASEGEIFANPDCSKMFYDFGYSGVNTILKRIIFENFNTTKVTNMSGMFEFCNSLTGLDLSNFDTSNVTDMSHMFWGCNNLPSLDLRNFNTSNVTDMGFMFGCDEGLQSLNLSNFDTSKVTNMYYMFAFCKKLPKLDISHWDTSNVMLMGYMFQDCYKLSGSMTMSNPNIRTGNYSAMFEGCSTDPSAKFVVNYTSGCQSVAQAMVNTKSSNSNVVLGGTPSTLVDGKTFNDTISRMSGFSNISEIHFIQKSGSLSGTNVASEGNIKARRSGSILYIEANGTIFANPDSSKIFENFGYSLGKNKILNKIIFENFNTTKVTNMLGMFSNCSSLTSINLSELKTSKVTNMSFMFNNCNSLQNADINSWDTSKVTAMDSMFNNCSSLQNLDVSKFRTSQVTQMGNMFNSCSSLFNLNLTNFDISNVINMDSMFNNCNKLSGEITITNPRTLSYIDMFRECSTDPSAKFIVKYISPETKEIARQMVETKKSGTTIGNVYLDGELPNILIDGKTFNNKIKAIPNFANVTEIQFVQEKPNPNGIDVSEAGEIKAHIEGTVLSVACEGEIMANSNCRNMFEGLSNIKNIVFTNFNTSKVTDLYYMFSGCTSLQNLDLSKWDTNNITNLKFTFYNCNNLTNIVGIENFNTSKVTDLNGTFFGIGMTNIDLSSWDVSKVTNMRALFASSSLENINVKGWNTVSVTDMGILFNQSKCTSIDVSGWNTSNVTNMEGMFGYIYNLTEIVGIENFNTSKVTNTSNMFDTCTSLINLDLSKWDTHSFNNMYKMFGWCKNLSGNITIMNPNIAKYNEAFDVCSNDSGRFVVNYTSGCRTIAQNIVNTKHRGDIVLGSQVYLSSDEPNKEEPSVSDTVMLTIKDGNKSTMKEILAGEIGSLNVPSKEGMVFSGYFYDAEYTKPVSERDIISEDTTIYIKWEEIPQEETEIPQDENKDENLEVA